MYETTGALASVQPSRLHLLVVLPLLWALAATVARRRPPLAGRVALAGAAATLAQALLSTWTLLRAPGGRHLDEHLATLVSLGQLDLGVDLRFDLPAAFGAITIAVLALASVLCRVWSARDASALAWTGLLSGGALLLVVGDGLATLAVGLGLSTFGALGTARERALSRIGGAIAADLGVVLAFLFTFWTLGGTFDSAGGYETDALPRLVLVASPNVEEGAQPTLAMTAGHGALVTVVDGPPLSGEPLRAPFEVPIPPSVYTFRVRTGTASGEIVVPHVLVAKGRSYTLAPRGPTTNLRALFDQLALERSTSAEEASARALLSTRTIAGLRASLVIAVLLLVSLFGRLIVLAARRGPAPVATAIEGTCVALFALHVAPLLALEAAESSALVAIGVAIAVALAGHAAAAADDPFTRIRGALAALASIAVVAVLVDEAAGGLALVVAASAAAAALLVGRGGRHDASWLGVAAAALVGLFPAAGACSGLAAIVSRSYRHPPAGQPWAAVLSTGILLAVLLTAAAAFRGIERPHGAAARLPASRGSSWLLIALAVASQASGVPYFVRWTASPGDKAIAMIMVVLAGGLGMELARRARGTSRAPSILSWPARALAAVSERSAAALRFLAGGVVVLERQVLDDLGGASVGLVLAAGRAIARVETATDGPVLGDRIAWMADAAVARLGLDHPRVGARVSAVLVFVMVALLALLVLSSLLLA